MSQPNLTPAGQHRWWLHEAERIASVRSARAAGLEALAHRQAMQGKAMTDRDPKANADFVAHGMIVNDQEMKELEILRQRAVQNAIMYGIAVLVERA